MTKIRMSKQVEVAAKKATGMSFELVKGDGYFYFVFDNGSSRYETHSVYVMYLSHLPLESWVFEAEAFAQKIAHG